MAGRVLSFLVLLGALLPAVVGSPTSSNSTAAGNRTTSANTTSSHAPLLLAASSNSSVQLFTNASSLPSSMSAACTAALMANISCSELINPGYVAGQGYLDTATLTTLCTTGCASALAAFQSAAESACGSAAYVFPGNYSQTIPAIVEPFVWAHDVACVQNDTAFCLPLVTNTTSGITPCSDCFLKYEAAMLGSPYGQERVSPDDFSSLLAACSEPASSYPYTTPAPTSASATVSGSASATASAPVVPTCTGTAYTVQAGDSCLSVAAAHNVATDRLITDNGFDYNCTNIVAGAQICIPASCRLHVVTANDTCAALLVGQSYYRTQLLSWNPTIHTNCDNLDAMVGRGICISPPNSTAYDVVPANTTTNWNVTFVLPTTSFTMLPNQTAAPNYTTSYMYPPLTSLNITTTTMTVDPTAAANYANLTKYCPITYNETQDGWTIYDLPDDCQDALEVYCEPSDNATMPTSTTFPSTCSPAYWESSTSSAPPSSVFSSGAATSSGGPPAPTQTGVVSDCNKWYVVVANDTCADIVSSVGGITLQQFYSWNPAVGSDCHSLNVGYAVCIGVSGSTSVSPTNGPTSTAPSPVMPSTDPDCTSYYFVQTGDTCADIEAAHSISADEFNEWNPYIGADCKNLWASEYICIGAPYTATPTPTKTTTPTPTPTSTVPSPLMPSTDAQCTQYHQVVSGDSCYDLEQTYSITANQFNAWNPYVGTDCASLWAGYYVCVKAP